MNIITTTEQFKHIQSWNAPEIPQGYALLDDSVDTALFYQYNGCVDLTVKDNTVTAIAPNVTAWNTWKATQPTQEETLAADARNTRDKRLTACDWTQVGDCPLDEATKTAWQTYRQALRDVPNQSGFPNDINWPEMPD
ncbi:tail fiber assembly protein [Bengtsoniella intestinalis]|uniref:tail fiber assembly protein n=1 Tax=Bengtsoniella intestinalis TaxID=3073143 RepID=UPI00391F1F0E